MDGRLADRESRIILTDLIAAHVGAHPGPDTGRCYVCGRETITGHRRPPSDLFTAWSSCQAGDVLCASCRACISLRPVRMFSWLVTADAFRPQTKDDKGWLWDVLVQPPEPPFAIYVTRGGQKQGWLTLTHAVSQSRQRYCVGTDWTDRPVLMDGVTNARIAPLIVAMRGRKIGKAALLAGDYSMKAYERAMTEGWLDDVMAAKGWAGDPRWEVLVQNVA